jgi:lactate permease
MAGFRGMIGVWPACLVAGLSFAVPQFFVSNYFGPNLVDIVAAANCIVCTYLFLKVWQPKEEWRFADDEKSDKAAAGYRSVGAQGRRRSAGEAFMGWMPWIVLSVLVFIWGLPSVKNALNGIFNPTFKVPYLHNLVLKAPPVAAKVHPEGAIYALNLLSATGTGLFLAGVIAGLWLKLSPGELITTYLGTLKRVRYSLLTIAAMLALGFTTRYSGSDSTMGLAFASTGMLFPFFSPLLGWLGVALTGSDTSSNVLFGNLQVVSAKQIGMNPLLAAASNSSGGVMGKMIDAQSIVVASVATKQDGKEGEILKYVFWHSLVLACLVGVVVFAQAYWLTWMVPKF